MVRPNYSGNGFVNLVASLVESRGGPPHHPPLQSLPVAELKTASNVVFLIVDGLGDSYLRANGAGGHIARHWRGAISAVFPSTTASAITTSFTGATPLEHGLTGWVTYFSQAARVGSPLRYQRRAEKGSPGGAPARLFAEGPPFARPARRGIVGSYRPLLASTHH